MKSRCYNPNVDCYKHYGGRGIYIASEWDTFEKFLRNLPEGYSPNLELDRVDVNKEYSKQNCRWTTRSVNCYNRRTEQGGCLSAKEILCGELRSPKMVKVTRSILNKNPMHYLGD
jgi:hypothetical protein